MDTRSTPLKVVAFGWALSAALIVLYVLCLLVAVVFPQWQGSHAWVGLFSVAPISSLRVWVDGILFSIVFGWVAAIAFGCTYNWVVGR